MLSRLATICFLSTTGFANAQSIVVSGVVPGSATHSAIQVVALSDEAELVSSTVGADGNFSLRVPEQSLSWPLCVDIRHPEVAAREVLCLDADGQSEPGYIFDQVLRLTDHRSRVALDLDRVEALVGDGMFGEAERALFSPQGQHFNYAGTYRFFTLWAGLVHTARLANYRLSIHTLDVARQISGDGSYAGPFMALPADRQQLLIGLFANGLRQGYDHAAPLEGLASDRRVFHLVPDIYALGRQLFPEMTRESIVEASRFCLNSLPVTGQGECLQYMAVDELLSHSDIQAAADMPAELRRGYDVYLRNMSNYIEPLIDSLLEDEQRGDTNVLGQFRTIVELLYGRPPAWMVADPDHPVQRAYKHVAS